MFGTPSEAEPQYGYRQQASKARYGHLLDISYELRHIEGVISLVNIVGTSVTERHPGT